MTISEKNGQLTPKDKGTHPWRTHLIETTTTPHNAILNRSPRYCHSDCCCQPNKYDSHVCFCAALAYLNAHLIFSRWNKNALGTDFLHWYGLLPHASNSQHTSCARLLLWHGNTQWCDVPWAFLVLDDQASQHTMLSLAGYFFLRFCAAALWIHSNLFTYAPLRQCRCILACWGGGGGKTFIKQKKKVGGIFSSGSRWGLKNIVSRLPNFFVTRNDSVNYLKEKCIGENS